MRFRALIAAMLAICLGFLTACSGGPGDDGAALTYEEIRNTGLANNCPSISSVNRGSITLDPSSSYEISSLCLQPEQYFVKEEGVNKRKEAEFIKGRVLTRKTSSLDQIEGPLQIQADGSLKFTETDGFDFQAITVLLPGGEEVPFLFTIKKLVATSKGSADAIINGSTDLEGDFFVPSYRGATFLDPKGRGIASGYDNAVALPAQADNDELEKENIKSYDQGEGHISLQITKVEPDTNEIEGTFISVQPSDTDLGSKEPLDVKIIGSFYGLINEA
ncbi:MAG: photosystem II manganese-stabilizing polypeptide [Cyanobacteria bacterium P01_D01_bin.73]